MLLKKFYNYIIDMKKLGNKKKKIQSFVELKWKYNMFLKALLHELSFFMIESSSIVIKAVSYVHFFACSKNSTVCFLLNNLHSNEKLLGKSWLNSFYFNFLFLPSTKALSSNVYGNVLQSFINSSILTFYVICIQLKVAMK